MLTSPCETYIKVVCYLITIHRGMCSAWEYMGVWVYGCMGAWVHGCTGVWVYGCTGVRVYGCMLHVMGSLVPGPPVAPMPRPVWGALLFVRMQ